MVKNKHLYGEHKKTYHTWYTMIWRCKQTSGHFYRFYGSRGITVCKRWLNFDNFINDMGDKPEGTTLERIDNDKGYSPDNCKWVSHLENSQNKRNCHYVTANGKTQTVSAWARDLGISQPQASRLINKYPERFKERVAFLQV